MKRMLGGILALGVWMTPVTVTLMAQPSWGQSQESQVEDALRLLQQGGQETQQGQPLQAIETLQQALTIARQIQNKQLEVVALLGIGKNYLQIGKPRQALDLFNQALPIFRQVGYRLGEATILNNIGQVYSDIGQPQQALAFYNQALPIYREVSNRLGEATILNNIGQVYSNIGQPQQALAFYNQALPIIREVGDRSGEAAALNNIGQVYSNIGQPQQALNFYNQALLITQEVGNRLWEASTLNNIGQVYSNIGQLQQALKFFNQALPIHRQVGNRSGEATTLNNIGGVYSDIGKPQQALDFYNQALPISREVGNRLWEASTLNNIGGVYLTIGQPQQALKFFNQALDFYNQALLITREVGDRSAEATTLNNMGTVYLDIGQPQQALDFFNQTLPIDREVGDLSAEATTLSNIASTYQKTNQPDKAITNWEHSITIALETRGGLQQENRRQFLLSGTPRGSVVALVDLLIDQNQPNRAFEWSNRVTTFDLADYTRLIDAKVSNPEAQQLIDQWNQNYQRIQFLYRRLQENPSDESSQLLNDLWAENNKLAEDISRRFPEVAELFEITPTDIAQLQANIPEGTVVIQPVLLTNIKNVPDNIAIFVLSANSPTQVTKVPINPAEFDQLLTNYYQQLTNPNDDRYDQSQEELYDILIRPVEAQIQAASPKRLAIIATEKLRYIPFETFYDTKTEQYLIEKYPIHYLTRISATKTPETQPSSSTNALVLGNPVPFPPQHLPGAEEESKAIHQFIPGKLFINDKATLETFKLQAPRFTIQHLATHGCFQKGGCPNLEMEENTLLFANKEHLHIRDAALLGLENTELIALSACQTAMQADSNGEEIAGLAYLFERAGARAVMATLWSAADEATKDIMVKFYENIKDGKMSKAEALQKAKLATINSDYEHPFFWSPLILIGNGN